MTGIVKSIPNNKNSDRPANFCFIITPDGIKHFLHKENLIQSWDLLKATIAVSKQAVIEFETEEGLQGPRAKYGARIVNV